MAASDKDEIARLGSKMMHKILWVVIARPAAPQEAIDARMLDHLRHQIRLEKEGVMFAAGPLSERDDEWDGIGMFVIRAADREEARRIVAADPMFASGLRTYTLYRWMVNEGRINVSLDISDGTVRLD